ncbi:MAG: hypothetical protein WC222_07365 [Parachlamydiales bacterium]|jgi:hypothetical protein
MKLKNLFTCCLIVLATCFAINLEASFINNGRFLSDAVRLNVGGTLDNNGEIIGRTSINLSCEALVGKGKIQAPKIVIKTKIFAYTGKISCSESCIIIVSEPFNEKMFKKEGSGKFDIIVDSDDNPKPVRKSLVPATLEFTVE